MTPETYTAEEVKAAKEVRDQIISRDITELKSVYMAGEIVMWASQQSAALESENKELRKVLKELVDLRDMRCKMDWTDKFKFGKGGLEVEAFYRDWETRHKSAWEAARKLVKQLDGEK